MAIYTTVENKTVQGRIFHAITFFVLTIGGITMLYPFVLMISGSFRSEMDEANLSVVPPYFYSSDVLYRKFLEFKYQQNISLLNRAYLTRDFAFYRVAIPEQISATQVADFKEFYAEGTIPVYWQVLGGVEGQLTVPENLRKMRKRLKGRFDDDIENFAREAGVVISGWQQFVFTTPDWLSQRFDYSDDVVFQEYFSMLEEAPAAERYLLSLSGYFLDMIAYPQFGAIENFNQMLQQPLQGYHEFRLPATVPGLAEPQFREKWLEFVLQDLNLSFLLLEDIPDDRYQAYLRESYQGNLDELNRVWESNFTDFDQILLPQGEFLHGGTRQDYLQFIQDVPPEHYRLIGPEYTWRVWLESKYGDLAAINEAHGTAYSSMEQIWMPFADMEMAYTKENGMGLRWTFAKRNYVNVIDAIFVEGRAFMNTVIFCTLSVIVTLLVNPLAAYALSRFQLPGTYKILLLMMAVMAFPPMVTTIPVFIMMQNLGLMNTFVGLLLPTIANGYLIFLLKGFFDSLPRELYDAALIDGAGEFRMFWNITMALSKPILAVVGLTAFNSAYTVFLFALIIAPAEDMWLLPVWLYQYRETVSMGGVFASVILASIPPIVVFVFAQNIILRGIVVPVEK